MIKFKKIFMIIILILLIEIILLPMQVRASVSAGGSVDQSSADTSTSEETEGDTFLNDISTGASEFLNRGSSRFDDINFGNSLIERVLSIAQLLYFVGCVIVIGGTIWMAVQYGMSGPNDKAMIKNKLVGWVITSVIMIGAVAVWNLIIGIFED